MPIHVGHLLREICNSALAFKRLLVVVDECSYCDLNVRQLKRDDTKLFALDADASMLSPFRWSRTWMSSLNTGRLFRWTLCKTLRMCGSHHDVLIDVDEAVARKTTSTPRKILKR